MYAPLGLPAKYKPIQSVEVAEAIPFHAAVSVPPAGDAGWARSQAGRCATRNRKTTAGAQLRKAIIRE
jgi:hypothetical protein